MFKIKPQTVKSWATGSADFQVVGESHYLPALRGIAQSLGGGFEGEAMTSAILVPEPSNKFDPNAVAVSVTGETVGYIPRESAAEYSLTLGPMAANGVLLEVPARVWWGEGREGDWIASVSLDLPHAGLLFPVNAMPDGLVVLMPSKSRFSIRNVGDFRDAVDRLLDGKHQALALVTLHEVALASSRTPKMLVEVRADGQPLGSLAPAASKSLAPVLSLAEKKGALVVAHTEIAGNSLVVEAFVHAAKATELDETWLAGLTGLADWRPGEARTSKEMDTPHSEAASTPPATVPPPPTPPADWYTDPHDSTQLRYWDGGQWTEHTHRYE